MVSEFFLTNGSYWVWINYDLLCVIRFGANVEYFSTKFEQSWKKKTASVKINTRLYSVTRVPIKSIVKTITVT